MHITAILCSSLFTGNDWVLTKPDSEPELPSRRLEGVGAVIRDRQNQPDESYLLLKLGPGGYRYHNTEGSIIFFANGKPLIYDGGEAGETWRHSTLSFLRLPYHAGSGACGTLFDSDLIGFTQGVSPKVLKAGEANYLNDKCRPEDVELGFRNYHEPNPANSRSLFWVKNDYLIMHDALNIDSSIPTHWHLQIVGDDHTGESGRRLAVQGTFRN